MLNKKGLTLIEIVVVGIIVAVTASVVLPNYVNYTQQASQQAAQNNLISVYSAQKNFYYSHGYYCTNNTTQPITCGPALSGPGNLDAGLNLNVTDNFFSYGCTDPGNNGSTFTCTATNISTPAITVTLQNRPIVLPGGTGLLNPVNSAISCTPITSCPSGDICGTISDNCGGSITCGTLAGACPGGQYCSGNTCVSTSSVSGACGSGAGSTIATPSQYCSSGTATGITTNAATSTSGATITWTCVGSGGGSSASCAVCMPGSHPTSLNCNNWTNSCGASVNCGSCSSPQTCGGGTPSNANVCGCTPITGPCPTGDNCGTIPDGCGGTISCGSSCTSPQVCHSNACCSPLTTCPTGDNCGTIPDGCGGTVPCGTCSVSGQTCGGGGTPNVCGAGCVPKTCSSLGLNCGAVTGGDGCGNPLNCGSTCAVSGQTCGGGGTANVCGFSNGCGASAGTTTSSPATPCTIGSSSGTVVVNATSTSGAMLTWQCPGSGGGSPANCSACEPSSCPSGYNCGNYTNSCGTSINCGTCSGSNPTCGGGSPGNQIPNVCGCTPATCPTGANCGTMSDGCGHTITCGPSSCIGVAGLPDNGIYASCGAVSPNVCGCVPTPASSTCPSNYLCGSITNSCGTTVSCGSCSGGQTCTGSISTGFSCTGTCVPTTCAAQSANCGNLPTSMTCGTTVNCGTCTPPQTCGGNAFSTPNVCGCTPETDATHCANIGANCGTVHWTDNCGTLRSALCTSGTTCTGSGGTPPCYCSGTGQTCGGGPVPNINIVSATYGSSCGVSAGNVTSIVASTCSGLSTCSFTEGNTLFGDPAPGCSKNFSVTYTCPGGSGGKTVNVAAVIGENQPVTLTCTATPNVCACTPSPVCGSATCGSDKCGTACGSNGGACPFGESGCTGSSSTPGTCSVTTPCGSATCGHNSIGVACGSNGGSCPSGESACTGGGYTPGTCSVTTPCGSATCGEDSTGASCGSCPSGKSCTTSTSPGTCYVTTPCGSAPCGEDSTGASCGSCPSGKSCTTSTSPGTCYVTTSCGSDTCGHDSTGTACGSNGGSCPSGQADCSGSSTTPGTCCTPSGSYTMSCNSCSVSGNTLTCSCGTIAGPYQSTSLNLSTCTGCGGISNINGNLECGSGGAPYITVTSVISGGTAVDVCGSGSCTPGNYTTNIADECNGLNSCSFSTWSLPDPCFCWAKSVSITWSCSNGGTGSLYYPDTDGAETATLSC